MCTEKAVFIELPQIIVCSMDLEYSCKVFAVCVKSKFSLKVLSYEAMLLKALDCYMITS